MKKKNKTILVTGGAGFIGSAIVKRLVKKKFNIINIDKLTYASNLKNLNEIKKFKNYKFIKIDIAKIKPLKNIFYKFKPSYVINCAAETHVDRSITNSKKFIDSNIIGTYNLLQCIKDTYISKSVINKNKFKLFHQVSTDEVFGDSFKSKFAPNEKSSYNPSSPYSASKASADHLVSAWGRTYKIPYSISICTNNYGPYQFPEKLIPKTIINALQGKKIPIYGNGLQIRDWLFVNDHASAIEKIIFNRKSIGNKFNISGNNQINNLSLANTICKYLNLKVVVKPRNVSKFEDLIHFVDDRLGHDKKYFLDSKKISKTLKWSPKHDIKYGLEFTIDWYLNNIKWWRKKINNISIID